MVQAGQCGECHTNNRRESDKVSESMDRTLQRCESEHKWRVDSLSARQEYYRDREAYAGIEERKVCCYKWVSFLWIRGSEKNAC